MKKLAMIFGAMAVAVSLTVGVVSAQDDGTGRPFGGRPRAGLDILRAAAEIVGEQTGLTPVEILRDLRGTDATLASIIEDNGGNIETTINEIVALLTEKVNQAVTDGRITQERADEILAKLPEMVTNVLNRDPQRGAIGQGLRSIPRDRALLSAVVEVTGLEAREVFEQVRDGKTLGEVVTENGGDVQAVIDAALATATERLNTAVTDGRIDQARADELLARLETAYTEMMNGTLREHIRSLWTV